VLPKLRAVTHETYYSGAGILTNVFNIKSTINLYQSATMTSRLRAELTIVPFVPWHGTPAIGGPPTAYCWIFRTFSYFFCKWKVTKRKLLRTFFYSILKVNRLTSRIAMDSHNNASNMFGRYAGMQALLRNVNPLAFYIPCMTHSLNLVGFLCNRLLRRCCQFFWFCPVYVHILLSLHSSPVNSENKLGHKRT